MSRAASTSSGVPGGPVVGTTRPAFGCPYPIAGAWAQSPAASARGANEMNSPAASTAGVSCLGEFVWDGRSAFAMARSLTSGVAFQFRRAPGS